ncbi:MAG: thioredoxin-dependent thiol peroxidase [Micavibrio aeruginosavorus]|uniref:thioredoxin-dependent peroxiredoxin n=1 Tax=Micavibrio aeruginosavorus TaxID=349221 RepID=A0A7T5UHX2_9BACT|nr:MAG: thioredoxin-dependent thiol peroxidase [Micavibrio aeruginosavorus]
MSALKNGSKAPDFTLPADGGDSITLSKFKGAPVVVYFYPKDDTSGCTQEACDFRDNLAAFRRLKTQVIGISKDSVKKHDKFKEKYDLNFPLLSDEDSKICEKYGVWVEKSMYGKKYMGIERSTFLIDAEGKIAHIWRKVSVTGHVSEVLKLLKEIKKTA